MKQYWWLIPLIIIASYVNTWVSYDTGKNSCNDEMNNLLITTTNLTKQVKLWQLNAGLYQADYYDALDNYTKLVEQNSNLTEQYNLLKQEYDGLLQAYQLSINNILEYGATIDQLIKSKDNLRQQINYIESNPPLPTWRFFNSPAEFQTWLEKHMTLILGVNGLTPDCDDYTQRLHLIAYLDGYILSEQLVEWGRIFGVVVADTTQQGHIGLLTLINGGYWYSNGQLDNYIPITICNRD